MINAAIIHKIYGIYPAISSAMAAKSEFWYRMYSGRADWLGGDTVSLALEQGIVREISNIALNEMTVKISGNLLENIFNSAVRELGTAFQQGLASGALVIKPLGGSGDVQYLPQNSFIPLKYSVSNRLTDAVFPEIRRISEGNFLVRLERQRLGKDGLTISNRAFVCSSPDVIGREISLKNVADWANLPEIVRYPNMKKPAFGYYVNPIANTVDGSACGMSVFAAATGLIRRADEQFGRLDWEFKSAERKIHVDAQAVRLTNSGEEFLDSRLYRGLELMQSGGDLYREYSPNLRGNDYIRGLEEYRRAIEFAAGLSYGDISAPAFTDKTAAEVRAARQRKYNTVSAVQSNLKICLHDLAYALAFFAGCTADFSFSCTFEDSILTTDTERRRIDREEVAMGAMSLVEYRMKWYGESELQAISSLSKM